MNWTLEVVVLPVSDIDAALAFYRDKVGFELDHDTKNEHMHVVQLTPRGSGRSIVIGDLPAQNEMAPGSIRGLQLVVADAAAARQELLDRGVEAGEIMVFDLRRLPGRRPQVANPRELGRAKSRFPDGFGYAERLAPVAACSIAVRRPIIRESGRARSRVPDGFGYAERLAPSRQRPRFSGRA